MGLPSPPKTYRRIKVINGSESLESQHVIPLLVSWRLIRYLDLRLFRIRSVPEKSDISRREEQFGVVKQHSTYLHISTKLVHHLARQNQGMLCH